MPVATVGGLPIAVITRAACARLMVDLALARRSESGPAPVFTSANGQVLSMCEASREVRALFLACDVINADGMPLVFASHLLSKRKLPERVATTDLVYEVAAIAQERGASFYLLGAAAGVIEQAAEHLRRLYPRLAVVGARHGYFSAEEETDVVAAINAARPDILWLGLGVPAEQQFALRHRAQLHGVGIVKTSGGLFDFLSGKNRRAPEWMQAAGLEWAYRIYLEPRRLLGRYVRTNPHA
ncbi:MAG: WecB/TagA/CpsF family glycosyltransferase, partial [Xanthobacteraceae bacterium]|nr:WecB/TagA/CpsF family glycosyltransferase [Xanthobacteraceae bacterium]